MAERKYGDYIQNKHLFATVLALAGWSEGTISRMLNRSPSDLVTQWGQGEALQQGMSDREKETIPAVLQYLQTLGSQSLKGLLQAGGMYHETAQQVVDSVQDQTRGTPTLQAVLTAADRITGQPMSANLKTTLEGMGVKVDPVLTTTRTQWKGADEPEPATTTTTTARPAGRETTGVQNLLHPLLTPQKRTEDLLTGPEAGARFTPPPAPAADLGAIGADDGTGAPGGPGGGPAGEPPPPPPTPEELRASLEERFGWAAALMDEPDVAAIINDYMAGDISLEQVGRRWKSTNYYKQTTQAQRDWKILEHTSPREAERAMEGRLGEIQNFAQPLGIDANNPRLNEIARLSLVHDWTDDRIQTALASELRYDPTGQANQFSRQLKEQSRQWLVPLSDQTMERWAYSIAAGNKTEEEFRNYLRDSAKSYLPSLAGVLDDPNITPMDYLSPYGEVAAQTLGINPQNIKWTESKWMRPLTSVDPDTGKRTVMPLADWKRTLMNDPEYGWADSVNGKTERASLGKELLRRFGYEASR